MDLASLLSSLLSTHSQSHRFITPSKMNRQLDHISVLDITIRYGLIDVKSFVIEYQKLFSERVAIHVFDLRFNVPDGVVGRA